jgi:DNA-binding transcriptional MerR regulator
LDKSPDAFRTISEVADELDVPQHVLRFWESRFPQIRPMKRAGGRRYYRPDDVDLLRGIRHLLYEVGYTIKGVQGVLRDRGPKFVQTVWQQGAAQPERETHESVEALAPDDAARTLFGLLQAPAARPHAKPEAAQAASPLPAPRLTHDHVRRLQSALHELRECHALIDKALKGEAA